MSNLLWALIIYISLTPLFILISFFSVEYHIVKYNISLQVLELFLKNLRSPLKELYAPENSVITSLFMGHKYKNSLDYWRSASQKRATIGRILYSLLPLLMIGSIIVGFPKVSSLSDVILSIIMLILVSTTLILCWRFGNKLSEQEE